MTLDVQLAMLWMIFMTLWALWDRFYGPRD